jgi:hypothetical protein
MMFEQTPYLRLSDIKLACRGYDLSIQILVEYSD